MLSRCTISPMLFFFKLKHILPLHDFLEKRDYSRSDMILCIVKDSTLLCTGAADLLKERFKDRMLCCRLDGILVRPREEQSTTLCPRLQKHMVGQIDRAQSPKSPVTSSRVRQASEGFVGGMALLV